MAQFQPKHKSASAIAEEQMIAGEIRKADQFMVCLVLGPFNRHKRTGIKTYQEALDAAAELDKLSQFGRRSIVYAVNKLGSFPIDEHLAQLAGLI
jgi:hypothetical protein